MKLSETEIAIIGLGQVGGSLAASLKQSDDPPRIVGCDINEDLLQAAKDCHIIDEALRDVSDCLPRVGFVILAIPVRAILDMIPRVAGSMSEGAVLLDTGSTKKSIVTQMNRIDKPHCFGGHPIAGTEASGPESWDEALFAGRRFAICRTRSSAKVSEERVEALVKATGATPLWIDAETHDALLAVTSHLPILIANALLSAAANHDAKDLLAALTAGSFDSATRVVAKSPHMISDMLSTNADALENAYASLDREARRLLGMLEDPESLEERLKRLHKIKKRDFPGDVS